MKFAFRLYFPRLFMLKIRSLLILLILPAYTWAQGSATLNIQVFDAQSMEPLKKVKISSRFVLNTNKKTSTDFLGRVALVPVLGDTISFDHPDYYHLHIVLHDHAPHDFAHPLKVFLTKLHPEHEKDKKATFQNTSYTQHHFEPQQAHHQPLKIGVIEDTRAGEHRKSWVATPRSDKKDFNLIDIHLRTKKQ
jgi:hypothetical protein